MNINKALLIATIFSLLSGCALFKNQEFDDADIALFEDVYPIPKLDTTQRPTGILVTYYGTSTLLFDDGKDAILVDGFFSRPSLSKLAFGRLKQMPEKEIDEILLKAGMSKLGAVVVAHSHHDHAMDAPCIALNYSAKLIGSDSTQNIYCRDRSVGKLGQVPEFSGGAIVSKPMVVGDFRITMILAKHGKIDGLPKRVLGINKTINNPLKMPAYFTKLKEGKSYSIFIEHPKGNTLVHASAGYESGNLTRALKDKNVDGLFLGVGNLSGQSDTYIDGYFKQVMHASQAAILVPIHWDDFTRSHNSQLFPAKRIFGNFKQEIELVIKELKFQDKQQAKPAMYLMNYADQVLIHSQSH